MSKRFERKLRALKYGGWAQFNINSIASIKDLIFWLETKKIRSMLEGDRVKLDPSVSTDKWYNTLSIYLSDHETCPFNLCNKISDMTNNNWFEIIEWLISHAILVDYEDNKFEYNKNKPIRRIKKKEYILSLCETKECHDALLQLCNTLKIPNNDDNLITAESLNTLISTKFNTLALANYESSLIELKDKNIETKDKFDQVKTFQDIISLYHHYEGFNTGDKKVDAAAIILKILYILDVRGLQNQLNEIVTFIQRFTANPRTNTKLGKVGY